jgi:hypothetical protein
VRTIITATILAILSAPAFGQNAKPRDLVIDPAPRFRVLYNEVFFPQTSPKATLASVVKAADLGQFDYVLVYLMDESFADAKIAERARELSLVVERDLRAQRNAEKADPFKPAVADPLPVDPEEFEKRIAKEATVRGFRQMTLEVKERFAEDPSHLRELQKYLRDGVETIDGNSAKIALKSEKIKAMYFKKVNDKWFMEDRTAPLPAAAAPAMP